LCEADMKSIRIYEEFTSVLRRHPAETPRRIPRLGVTHGYRLPDEFLLPQPPLVGELPGEGELPVREAVEVVFCVINGVGGPAMLPESRL
jgi:hypothetical protein